MESSENKVEMIMKPFLVKAGISMAITLAGFIITRIVTRKPSLQEASKIQDDFEEGNSSEISRDDESLVDHTCKETKTESSVKKENLEFQEEIFMRMSKRMEDVQEREGQIEKHFICYQELRDKEMVLMEIHNKLMLEINEIEFLRREVLMVEAENKKFEGMVFEYLKVLGLLEFSRSKNVKMHWRMKKLLWKIKGKSRVLRKNSLCKKLEVLRNKEEMEKKTENIKNLEDEIKELKLIVEKMQEEKDDILDRLRMAEKSDKLKEKEEENVTMENYNQLASALEQLQQEEAAEVQELVYLKWCNACLRHELMRRNDEENNKHLVSSPGGTSGNEEVGSEDNELFQGHGHSSCLGIASGGGGHSSHSQAHHHSKRRKIIEKFKKWMDGIEKGRHLDEKEKHGHHNCFAKHSVSHVGKQGLYIKSCSSA